eukprot:4366211-Lingulodinium_polyedra.AAC.1
MQVAANYVWEDVRPKADFGLFGGGALSRVHCPTGEWAVSSFDENNAFTRVLVPPWMRRWCAAPPLRAVRVWSKLPAAVRRE